MYYKKSARGNYIRSEQTVNFQTMQPNPGWSRLLPLPEMAPQTDTASTAAATPAPTATNPPAPPNTPAPWQQEATEAHGTSANQQLLTVQGDHVYAQTSYTSYANYQDQPQTPLPHQVVQPQQAAQGQEWDYSGQGQSYVEVSTDRPATLQEQRHQVIVNMTSDAIATAYSNGFHRAVEEMKQLGVAPEWAQGTTHVCRCLPFSVPSETTHPLLARRKPRTEDLMLTNVPFIDVEIKKAAAAIACLFKLQPWEVPIISIQPDQAGEGLAKCQVIVRLHLPADYQGFLRSPVVRRIESLNEFLAHVAGFEEGNLALSLAQVLGIFPGELRAMNYENFYHPVSYLLYREIGPNQTPLGHKCAAYDAAAAVIQY